MMESVVGGGMSAVDSVAIGAFVTGLTTVTKWIGLSDKKGPLAVLVLAAVGVAAWLVSQPLLPTRLDLFGILGAWLSVVFTAGGIFGLTRAMPGTFTEWRSPPAGASQEPTAKI